MYKELKNTIDFFIRNKTKFSKKNFIENDIELLKRNRQENIYTKEILSKYFTKTEKKSIRVLDIGCKNWFYARGEYAFFDEFSSDFTIDGVELDAHRLYSNFYSRFETAKFYTKGLKNTNYIADNLMNIKNKYDYIIWFLPFVIEEPHKMWGLPKKMFYPKKLLKHAYDLLNPTGQMLIINQGETEAIAQKEFLKELGIEYTELGEIKSSNFTYQYKRYGYLINKK